MALPAYPIDALKARVQEMLSATFPELRDRSLLWYCKPELRYMAAEVELEGEHGENPVSFVITSGIVPSEIGGDDDLTIETLELNDCDHGLGEVMGDVTVTVTCYNLNDKQNEFLAAAIAGFVYLEVAQQGPR